MQIDWWTLGLQAVNALVLIWLLAHFLFRPVVNAIGTRQKAAGQLLAVAKAAKEAADSERDKAAAETARLVEHRSEALKAAEAEATTSKATIPIFCSLGFGFFGKRRKQHEKREVARHDQPRIS